MSCCSVPISIVSDRGDVVDELEVGQAKRDRRIADRRIDGHAALEVLGAVGGMPDLAHQVHHRRDGEALAHGQWAAICIDVSVTTPTTMLVAAPDADEPAYGDASLVGLVPVDLRQADGRLRPSNREDAADHIVRPFLEDRLN